MVTEVGNTCAPDRLQVCTIAAAAASRLRSHSVRWRPCFLDGMGSTSLFNWCRFCSRWATSSVIRHVRPLGGDPLILMQNVYGDNCASASDRMCVARGAMRRVAVISHTTINSRPVGDECSLRQMLWCWFMANINYINLTNSRYNGLYGAKENFTWHLRESCKASTVTLWAYGVALITRNNKFQRLSLRHIVKLSKCLTFDSVK
jgi:hypothetical protein